ncbi:MAG TPA: UTP--glucose-1-phosphate uridylyltransferase GalU [Candidatus Paceibacterota bacterium]|nr:UTP--glucose-1-phosphate uridylyltransferase GalU [Candidatus Paceibacterota bacterium]
MEKKKIKKAILPVAGLGTRFLPATKAQPKEMLPLVDKPIIQFLIEEAVDADIEEIIFVTGKGKRAIEDHFDSSPELERALEQKGKKQMLKEIRRIADMVQVTYVRQKEARGVGDALLAASHLVDDEPVAVLFGDDIVISKEQCLTQMRHIYEKTGASVLGLERVPRSLVSQYGIIKGKKVEDRLYQISTIVEKPSPAEAPSQLGVVGKYILTPEIWQYLRKVKPSGRGEIELTTALDAFTQGGNLLYGYAFEGERFDCGSKLGFLKATVHLGLNHAETKKEFRKYLKSLDL